MFTRAVHGTKRNSKIMDNYNLKRLTSLSDKNIFDGLSALDTLCVGADGWSARDFYDEAAKDGGIVLAVLDGNKVIGAIAGFTASDTGEILTVAVAPEYRRQGIADTLMDRFFSLLPGETDNIALEVRQSNNAAISLYEKYGFEKMGVRRRFYRDPVEDADIMVKKIKRD